MEVWNNVFTQFDGDGKGNYVELANKNIDTGMGLERLAVVVQDVTSVFDIDTMKAIRDRICELANVKYQTDEIKDISIRLITDHIRSATFMISDGIMPTNEGRGYVLRRLIRRAARHGRLLGIDGKFLAKLSETVIEGSKDGYPELDEKKAFILNVLTQEEDKFDKTIDQGLAILADMEENMKKDGKTELSGDEAFKLYDTYGFPIDFTIEILEEKGFTVDEDGFKAEQGAAGIFSFNATLTASDYSVAIGSDANTAIRQAKNDIQTLSEVGLTTNFFEETTKEAFLKDTGIVLDDIPDTNCDDWKKFLSVSYTHLTLPTN